MATTTCTSKSASLSYVPLCSRVENTHAVFLLLDVAWNGGVIVATVVKDLYDLIVAVAGAAVFRWWRVLAPTYA